MPLWRIYPVADPRDSRWQGRRIWAEVVVRAESAAMARLIASKLDEPPVRRRLGNEIHCFRSGFEDEKLYWVRRLGAADAAHYDGASACDGVIVAHPLPNGAREAACRERGRESHLDPTEGLREIGQAAMRPVAIRLGDEIHRFFPRISICSTTSEKIYIVRLLKSAWRVWR